MLNRRDFHTTVTAGVAASTACLFAATPAEAAVQPAASLPEQSQRSRELVAALAPPAASAEDMMERMYRRFADSQFLQECMRDWVMAVAYGSAFYRLKRQPEAPSRSQAVRALIEYNP